VYARRTGRDRFEIVADGRVYHLKETVSGESGSWIETINEAINQYCS